MPSSFFHNQRHARAGNDGVRAHTSMQSTIAAHEIAIALTAAGSEDFEALLALRIEAMRESLERIGRFDLARARERFQAGFSVEHTRHIEVEGKRVGFVVVKPQVDCLLLDHLYIHPSTQSQGIGAAVLARVIEEANVKSLPIRVVALRESDSNRFYVRHGFVLVEQSKFDNYYIRTGKNAF
jgi:ribosomal protein S18 acetylase RimI-like enzyme